MRENTTALMDELRQLAAEFDKLRKCAAEELERGARSVEDQLRDNVWLALGLAAAAGVIVGALLTRRR